MSRINSSRSALGSQFLHGLRAHYRSSDAERLVKSSNPRRTEAISLMRSPEKNALITSCFEPVNLYVVWRMADTGPGLRLVSRARVAKQIFDTVDCSSAMIVCASVSDTLDKRRKSSSLLPKVVVEPFTHLDCKSFSAQ